MGTTEILIIIGAALVVIILAVLAVIMRWSKDRKHERLIQAGVTALAPAFLALMRGGDRVLAQYGDELKPVHDLLGQIKRHFDDPTDTPIAFVARTLGLPPEQVAEFVRDIWQGALQLTDGSVATDTDTPADGEAVPRT